MAIAKVQGGDCSYFSFVLQSLDRLSYHVRDHAKEGAGGGSLVFNSRLTGYGDVLVLGQGGLVVGLYVWYLQGGSHASSLGLVQATLSLEGCEKDYELCYRCFRIEVLKFRVFAGANSHSTYAGAYRGGVCLSIYISPSFQAYNLFISHEVYEIVGLSQGGAILVFLHGFIYFNSYTVRAFYSVYRCSFYAMYFRGVPSLGARYLERHGCRSMSFSYDGEDGASSNIA